MSEKENEFRQGQRVYDRSGLAYQFEEALSEGRALVRQIFEADTYEGTEEWPSDTGTILSASALSATEPVAKIAEEVSAAAQELAAVRAEIAEAKRDRAAQEREAVERVEALKHVPQLARIESFLAGEITHFAMRHFYHTSYVHGICVVPFDELARSKDDRGRFDGDIKLLSLFGRSNGDLQWRINQYYDGSGAWYECQPCASYEEALGVASEWIAETWVAYRAEPEKTRNIAETAKAADTLGVEVPDDIRDVLNAARLKSAQEAVDKAETDLAARRATLADAMLSTRTNGGDHA